MEGGYDNVKYTQITFIGYKLKILDQTQRHKTTLR